MTGKARLLSLSRTFMITSSYKENETPIISPKDFCPEKGDYADVCIIFFSKDVYEKAVSSFKSEVKGIVSPSIAREELRLISSTRIAFYLSQMGGGAAAMMMDEASYMCGAKSFVLFGSCGILDKDITKGKIIVPTSAYRDEGLSYHYIPNSDYVDIPTSSFTSSFFSLIGVANVQGKIWTTDAFYHETKEQMELRKKEGCIAVDMEIASLSALSIYRGYSFYPFCFGGDLLDAPVYDSSFIGDENETKSQHNAFTLAYLLSKEIASKIKK